MILLAKKLFIACVIYLELMTEWLLKPDILRVGLNTTNLISLAVCVFFLLPTYSAHIQIIYTFKVLQKCVSVKNTFHS